MRKNLVTSAVIAIVAFQVARYANDPMFACDFRVYYTGEGWLYIPWLRLPFIVLATLPFLKAYAVWMCVNVFLWLRLPQTLMEYRYGILVSLGCAYVSSWTIASGNCTPALAALCLTPAGTVLASLVKPWLVGFLALHLLVERYRGHPESGEVRFEIT